MLFVIVVILFYVIAMSEISSPLRILERFLSGWCECFGKS
uniref:Ion transport domain-containing protein n=1 Tax=Anguilla anguilla TaxID=7936 RepID=A0A0E9V0C5_ANGAN